MPAVRESSDETPETLEIVEVRPGVRLKLNAADRAAMQSFDRSSAADAARHTESKRLAAVAVLEPVVEPVAEVVVAEEATAEPASRAKPRTRKG